MTDNFSSKDPRVRRTHDALRAAILELAADRPFSAITVADITRQAGVNRKTFYLHFRDKGQLLVYAFDTVFAELTAESRALVAARGPLLPDAPPVSLVALFRRITERPALYHRLVNESGETHFADRLLAFYRAQFLELWSELGFVAAPGSPPPDFRASFAASATLGIAMWLLEQEHAATPDQAAAWLWRLIQPVWFEHGVRDEGIALA